MRKVNCYAIEYEVSLRGTEVRKETLLVPDRSERAHV